MPHRFTVEAPAAHFDLGLCVSSGQVFRWRKLAEGDWLGVDGERWYRVRGGAPAPPAERNALAYIAEAPSASARLETYEVESNGVREDFVRLFRLDWDADRIAKDLLDKAPELAPYLGALNGLRLMRPSSPTETFFSFLCTPNNNIPRIAGMVRRLASHGPILDEVAGETLHRFPDTATIAAIPPDALRANGFGYRGNTIPTAAAEVLRRGGDAYIASLKAVPYEQAFEELLSIPYIGPKLADCIALFALHHTEAVPLDTHLWQAVTRLYLPELRDKALTEARYRQAGALLRTRYGRYAGWAQQHLFFDNVLNWRSRK